ncbi:MAG: TonB-dependent receptor [Polyangiales bacterium]
MPVSSLAASSRKRAPLFCGGLAGIGLRLVVCIGVLASPRLLDSRALADVPAGRAAPAPPMRGRVASPRTIELAQAGSSAPQPPTSPAAEPAPTSPGAERAPATTPPPAADSGGPAAPPSPANTDGLAAAPPKVIRLAALRLPPDAPLPAKSELELFVLISADGSARPDQELPLPSLQLAAAEAIGRSEFQPAVARGVPVSARVRVRLRLVAPQSGATERDVAPAGGSPATPDTHAAPASLPPPTGAVGDDAPGASRHNAPTPADAVSGTTPRAAARAAPEPDADSGGSYGASARASFIAPTVRRLKLQEMRDLPGAFGDPFRVIDALPGVVPQLSGLPYVYVRGAPPAGTVYYYDGIQVPGMFHLALGPAVVHPALIDEVDFYASVAPARFGRFTGGVLSGGPSPRPPPTRISGELELRVIDVTGKVELPLGGGSLSVSGRYGYPGPVVSLFSPQSSLDYWDYQTRLSLPLSGRDRFEFVWFGSYDAAGYENSLGVPSTFVLEFHRAEARLIRRAGPWELGSALQFGFERSQIDTGLRAHATRIGPRIYASYRGANGLLARVGADMFGSAGNLTAAESIEEGPIQIRIPLTEDVAGRSVMGAYAELSVPVLERLRAELGVRADLWLTGSRSEAAVDPRLGATYRISDKLRWHGAVGLGHQPSVFLIPLPGIAEVGLEHGIQSAVQSETGLALDLPASLQLEGQLYVQRFSNMILPELALDQTADCAALPPDVAMATARCTGGYPRSSVWAYGLELFLRRSVTESLSGWINYTLGWARAESDTGERFRPTFDVRHVLNFVLQYRLGNGFSTGARVQFRSGKLASEIFLRDRQLRYEQRLPGFFRADLHVSYGWRPHWGSLKVTLEWFNVSLSRESTDIQCRDGVGVGADPRNATPCTVQKAPALFFPNLGIRAEF